MTREIDKENLSCNVIMNNGLSNFWGFDLYAKGYKTKFSNFTSNKLGLSNKLQYFVRCYELIKQDPEVSDPVYYSYHNG